MYTKEQIEKLSALIGEAVKNYRDAIAENLRTLGTEIPVQGDEEEINGVNINVEYDGSLYPITVDLIKWDNERSTIIVHLSSVNYNGKDEWTFLTDLGDAADYVLEAIQWQ